MCFVPSIATYAKVKRNLKGIQIYFQGFSLFFLILPIFEVRAALISSSPEELLSTSACMIPSVTPGCISWGGSRLSKMCSGTSSSDTSDTSVSTSGSPPGRPWVQLLILKLLMMCSFLALHLMQRWGGGTGIGFGSGLKFFFFSLLRSFSLNGSISFALSDAICSYTAISCSTCFCNIGWTLNIFSCFAASIASFSAFSFNLLFSAFLSSYLFLSFYSFLIASAIIGCTNFSTTGSASFLGNEAVLGWFFCSSAIFSFMYLAMAGCTCTFLPSV